MANQIKSTRSSGGIETQTLSFLAFGGCFLVSMALLMSSASYVVSFPSLNLWLSSLAASAIPLQSDVMNQNDKLERKSLCNTSNRKADICDIMGDIRVHGNSSSILFVTSSRSNISKTQESYRIKPHPRKGDMAALSHVTELTVRHASPRENTPTCAIDNKIPAIIFSPAGYIGNFFHEFSDVIIPLYATSQQFNGEVQFLISDMVQWWATKYERILKQLSHYEIIDLNNDPFVRCYPRVIVGIKKHEDMSIDPSADLTMVDLGRFIRSTYGLKRETAIKLGEEDENKKPRLLIIARQGTRRLTNVDEIARMAEMLGFEAVVSEKKSNGSLAEFAQMVNSCDAMLGVHGAGLTNLVFLPTNAVVIQVVPLGGLETYCWTDYGRPSLSMKMRYLQYSISVLESTLTEEYPISNPDFPVLIDPRGVLSKKDGVFDWTKIYFFKQNVKLDMDRFISVFFHALELLHQ